MKSLTQQGLGFSNSFQIVLASESMVDGRKKKGKRGRGTTGRWRNRMWASCVIRLAMGFSHWFPSLVGFNIQGGWAEEEGGEGGKDMEDTSHHGFSLIPRYTALHRFPAIKPNDIGFKHEY